MKSSIISPNSKLCRLLVLKSPISRLEKLTTFISSRLPLFITLLYISLLLNCAQLIAGTTQDELPSADQNKPVAKVGSLIITAEEFYNSYEFGPAFVKRIPDSKKKYLDYMINEKLLALKGYEEGLDRNTQARELHHSILSDLATEELFKDDILNTIEVTQADVDTVVNMKKIQLDISWLFSVSAKGIEEYWELLREGASFDSLLQDQLSDSVFPDMRTMQTNRYQLGKKNPLLAGIIDTLKVATYSLPIHTEDGWYIVKLDNVWQNMIASESETQKLIYEAREAVTKQKMDEASDKYVNNLLISVNPVIKIDVFKILRAYLAQYVLPDEKFREWKIKEKMDETLSKYNNLPGEEYNNLPLVQYLAGNSTLSEFLVWFRSRSQYIKFNQTDLASFSQSLEQLIWRMLRDKLLYEKAEERGYTKLESVRRQSDWWRDKICFSTKLNELQNSLEMNRPEVSNTEDIVNAETEQQNIEQELSIKLFREIQSLKKKYDIKVYDEELDNIWVSSENDPRAIELYTVKKGGLIPRTPYPVIDMIWKLWE